MKKSFVLCFLLLKAVASLRLSKEGEILNTILEQESGSSVILNCDFDIDSEEEIPQLDIKWYYNDADVPFLQWLPSTGRGPQLIGSEFIDVLDLEYQASEVQYKAHSSIRLLNPTSSLSGNYVCKVSTLENEELLKQKLLVFVPPRQVALTATFTTEEDTNSIRQISITCDVIGIYPQPHVQLSWRTGTDLDGSGSGDHGDVEGSAAVEVEAEVTDDEFGSGENEVGGIFPDSEVTLNFDETEGLYNITANSVMEYSQLEEAWSDLTDPIIINCEVYLPEANSRYSSQYKPFSYKEKKEISVDDGFIGGESGSGCDVEGSTGFCDEDFSSSGDIPLIDDDVTVNDGDDQTISGGGKISSNVLFCLILATCLSSYP